MTDASGVESLIVVAVVPILYIKAFNRNLSVMIGVNTINDPLADFVAVPLP